MKTNILIIVGIILWASLMTGGCSMVEEARELSSHIKGKVYCVSVQSSNPDFEGKHCIEWLGKLEGGDTP